MYQTVSTKLGNVGCFLVGTKCSCLVETGDVASEGEFLVRCSKFSKLVVTYEL
jgi:hypothetical protein